MNNVTIFSNYHLNPDYFDYYYVENLEDIHSLSNGIFLGDDLERVFSSKWMNKSAKETIADIILDLGKNSVSIWATTKRWEECEKSLRAISDRFLRSTLGLNFIPKSIEEKIEKEKYLNYLQLEIEVFDNPEEESIETELYGNLAIFKDLFDTKEIVEKVYKNG